MPSYFSWGLPYIAGLLLVAFANYAQASSPHICTHIVETRQVVDTKYYEDNGYKIGEIKLESPFGFFFLVSRRLDSWKKDLPIHAGDQFSDAAYRQASDMLDVAVEADSTFGEDSPLKVAFTIGNLANCDERADHKTLDVVYYVFSTDILSSLVAKSETHATSTEVTASEVAERNTQGPLKVVPLGGYNASYHGVGGGDAVLRIPAKIVQEFRFRGVGSASVLLLNGELSGKSNPRKKFLDTLDYHLSYRYEQRPTPMFALKQGTGQFRFTGVTDELSSAGMQIKLRFGASLEQGIQQSNAPVGSTLPYTVANSRYGAVRLYAGVTASTRYTETIASYGLGLGGSGLDDLNYAKEIGDISFNLRFPGGTHSPWDLHVRATGGGISGGQVLLNDRFYGGNVVAPFIPGDSWLIPGGPLVRSITANHLDGGGYGGTSFYSTNVTFGRVIKNWPLIPREIENTDGFSSGIQAGENTAEGYFYDTKLASSDAMNKLVTEYQKVFNDDLDSLNEEFVNILAASQVDPKLRTAVQGAQHDMLLARLAVKLVTGEKLRSLTEKTSGLTKLVNDLLKLEKLAPEASSQQLETLHATLTDHIGHLPEEITALEQTPEGKAARAYALQEMAHPRQVIDTLEHEANMLSIGLFAIFDSGRLWPDPNGTRYAYGGGVRLSVVNVNFNLGYAANPYPQHALRQGTGAILFGITYTNLF